MINALTILLRQIKERTPWSLVTILWVVGAIVLFGCNRDTPTPTPTATAVAAGQESAPIAAPAVATPAVSETTADATTQSDSGATTNPPNSTPTPPPVGTITLWHSWAEKDGDALAMILLTFAQRYPEIQVNTLFVAYNDLPQSYADAVQANAGPDLILAPNWWLGDLVNAGVVQSVDQLVTAGTVHGDTLDQFWPATLDNLRWQDELYGLPTNFELVALFYNKTLLADQALPTTADELLALAQSSPERGIGLYETLYHLYWGFPAYGAVLLDAEGRAILDQGDGAVAYLTWLAALNKVDGSYIDTDYGMLLDRFKKGEFAFLVDGPWSIDELGGALGADLGVTALPAGPTAAAQPWLNTDGIFFNPTVSAEQQWLAVLFAQHMTSAKSGTALAELANRLPANRNAVIENPLIQGFMAQGASAEPFPTLPEMDEVWGYGGDLLIKVLDADFDPAQAVMETTLLLNEANGK